MSLPRSRLYPWQPHPNPLPLFLTVTLNLNKLNERQRQAVLHGNGPLLVLAGAGSGKTSTMTYRIAHLVAVRYQSPSAILGLSFTRKAAMELRERVRKLIQDVTGPGGAKGLTITTFHSLCVRILRANAKHLGFQDDFSILDQPDQADIVRSILRDINLDDRTFDPDRLLFEIGQAKNRFLSPEETEAYFLESRKLPHDYSLVAGSVYTRYQAELRARNAMDFDDLLFMAVRLLKEQPEVRQAYRLKWRHVLVDEYQDTNPAQFQLLSLLCAEKNPNLCVVGDDDQSIYAWRGADAAHILEFQHHFEGAEVVTLDQNYRSTSTILDAANGVIAKNTKRHSKQLWSDRGRGEPITLTVLEEDRAEAEFVAEEILRRARTVVEGRITQDRPWKDFAILYRSNPQSRLFEEALRLRQIPYKMVGALSFLDRKEVKDLLCYWKVVVNPRDDASCRRILNWPTRGIGKGTIEAIHQEAVKRGVGFVEAIPAAPQVAPRAADNCKAFLNLIEKMRKDLLGIDLSGAALAAWGKRSLEAIAFKKGLEEDTDDPIQVQKRWENVDELCNSLGQIPIEEILEEERERGVPVVDGMTLLRDYITRMTLNALDEQEDQGDGKKKEKDEVTLLTLHGSKGLEYPVVFLVGLEEGLLPHKRVVEEGSEIDEERRLCYVGITRARDQLFMTRAKNRIRYGKPVPRLQSRFLEEIPEGLVVKTDLSGTPDMDSPGAQEAHETKVKDFLAGIRAQLLTSAGKGTTPARR